MYNITLNFIYEHLKMLIHILYFFWKLWDPCTHIKILQSIHILHLKLLPKTYHLSNTEENHLFLFFFRKEKLIPISRLVLLLCSWCCCCRELARKTNRKAKECKKPQKKRKKAKTSRRRGEGVRGVGKANRTSWGNQQTQVSKAKCWQFATWLT